VDSQDDYYALLGVAKNASMEQLKAAYKKAARQYHPDLNREDPRAEETFKKISEAFAVLSDPEKRQIYDRFGVEGLSGAGHRGFAGASVDDIFDNLSSIFGDFFDIGFGGGRRSKGRARRGQDLRYDLELTLEEVYAGAERSIEIPREESCVHCKGTGAAAGTEPTRCSRCGGRGQVIQSQGFLTISTTCPTCRGQGTVLEARCDVCDGRGTEVRKKTVTFKIPRGISEENPIQLQGEGGNGASRGDLYVVVHVVQHDLFKRDGDHLYCQMVIPLTTAILGGEIEVPTLSGEVISVPVQRGTQYGDLSEIPDRGLPKLKRPDRFGKLIVQWVVDIPKRVTKEQEALLRQFAALEQAQEPRGWFRRKKAE